MSATTWVIKDGVKMTQADYDRRLQQQYADQLQAQIGLANQQNQNAALDIYNANNIFQAQQGQAATGYGLAQDIASLGLQFQRGQQDLAQQQLANARYVQGLDEDVARMKYQRSATEAPSAFTQAKRMYGY